MKNLKSLLAKQPQARKCTQLFSQLRRLKNNKNTLTDDRPTSVVSQQTNNTPCLDNPIIGQIQAKLERFIYQKALDLLSKQQMSQESIDHIANTYKDQYQYQALCLIDQKYKRSAETQSKSPQEGCSTLPSSNKRTFDIQTPGFDLQESNYRSSKPAELSQFTLGQRDKLSSNQSTKSYIEDDSMVSQFRVKEREPASRRIKNKIMNPQSTRTDACY